MNWSEASNELSKPLDKRHVKPPAKYGPKGDYIEAWHAQAEANRVFGFGGWSQHVVALDCVHQEVRQIGADKKDGWAVSYNATVRVVVDGVTREDCGSGHGFGADLGLCHESASKEAVSDAMKRAFKSFGNPFGLALYDKSKANIEDTAAIEQQAAEAKRMTDACVGIENCASMDDLKAQWSAIIEEYGPVPPAEIVRTKDAMKQKIQEGAA